VTVHPGMRFSVDPWDPSYGVSLDAAEGQSRQEVDAGVELNFRTPGGPEGGIEVTVTCEGKSSVVTHPLPAAKT